MILSALISQCRREFGDNPKSTRATVLGDGSTTLFNLGSFPIVENSYGVYYGTSAKTETTHYTLDKDNGDLQVVNAVPSGIELKAEFKYATWRDANWAEVINQGIKELNARGYFKQTVREQLGLSANVRTYSGPTDCIDMYEVVESDDFTTSGNYRKLWNNWSYQQDANKLILGSKPARANYAYISYLRNLRTYSATSATLDVPTEWVELVKKWAGSVFYRHLAGKIAQQGNATIEEGHLSFTNLRTQANDLENEFDRMSLRKKPTRPAKEIQWNIPGGGVA